MGLSKKELLEQLRQTLEEVNKDLTHTVTLDYSEEKLLLLPMTWFREAQWWLRDLPELKELRKIRGYAKPEYWASIEFDPECEEFREVQLLRQAQRELRAAFRSQTRPDLFKKTVVKKELRSGKKN
jgi:hypothetical protein